MKLLFASLLLSVSAMGQQREAECLQKAKSARLFQDHGVDQVYYCNKVLKNSSSAKWNLAFPKLCIFVGKVNNDENAQEAYGAGSIVDVVSLEPQANFAYFTHLYYGNHGSRISKYRSRTEISSTGLYFRTGSAPSFWDKRSSYTIFELGFRAMKLDFKFWQSYKGGTVYDATIQCEKLK